MRLKKKRIEIGLNELIPKKKSKIEDLDNRIEKLKKRLLENPEDEKLKKQLRRTTHYQFYIVQKHTKLFGDFMKFERENNYERKEEI